ncbi:hypothetical protein [Bradyrhizobium sp. AZCC 1699]|uniref:hypothetical protein n=1 Tax=Bradyrhizobium sp. AZCC 1699 TaxID=3117024 RepID=UPI002FEFCC0F
MPLFDDGDLRIDQVANSPVIADFPQPPGDFAQHPRALADRGQPLLQCEAVERLDRRFLGRLDRAADGGKRLGQALLRRGSRSDGLGRLLRRKAFLPLEVCFPLKGLFPLGGEALLDPRHRVQHHAGVGIAVALGVFGQEPAAPRSLHEGFGDRSIVLLARQRGAC